MVKKGAHSVGSRKKKRSARTSPGSKISTLKRHDALLIIDAINDLTFPGGENVLPWALRLAPRLARFKRQARKHDMPVIYVNDNFGNWRSNFMDVYAHCTRPAARGKAICRRLRPNSQD